MRAHSLRGRIFVIAGATIVATLAAAGIMLVIIFEQYVLRRVAHDLDIRSLELAKAFELDNDGKPFLNHDLADPRYQTPYSGAYWQINKRAQPILRSRSLWDEALDTSLVKDDKKSEGAFEIDGPNKAELYVVERPVTLQNGDENQAFQLIVALDHDDVRETRSAFSMDVAKILAILSILLILGVYVQWRFGLLPLKSLRRKLNAVREGTAQRLEGPFPSEIAPLASDLNTLLDRQDELVRKARDRAGSLAHGLKTPLTILVREAIRLEKSGLHESANILREQIDAMRAHVERELARARTHGAVHAAASRTEVLPIVERLVNLMQRMETERGLDWNIEIPAGTFAEIENSDLAEIAGNLIDNARKWAKHRVSITINRINNQSFLAIRDDGPGVPHNIIATIAQRGVHAGRKGHDSSGLGLAIVADTLAEYGAQAEIINTETGFFVSFPINGLSQPPFVHLDSTNTHRMAAE